MNIFTVSVTQFGIQQRAEGKKVWAKIVSYFSQVASKRFLQVYEGGELISFENTVCQAYLKHLEIRAMEI